MHKVYITSTDLQCLVHLLFWMQSAIALYIIMTWCNLCERNCWQIGEIEDVRLITDFRGRSKGYAYVQFKDEVWDSSV